MLNTLLRLPAVQVRTGLSRSTIYLRISRGEFPKQVSLGERAVGWLESEINSWVDTRIQESRPDMVATLVSHLDGVREDGSRVRKNL